MNYVTAKKAGDDDGDDDDAPFDGNCSARTYDLSVGGSREARSEMNRYIVATIFNKFDLI